ncbi:neutral/alkaline non-lysosomal ceramidase N-terminal domain-containing protein [Emticicia sp. W12TSBA100-4]|uniref:neutral/alkaline non-lysosomal ceramidase N-terminal domain-containing protein n=1 Tax=Emticicia sp. W12TSBA100-4 TaxID=3160965 RepID=UPI003305A504
MKTKILLLFFLTFSYISYAQNNLKVGAAKIDITPELSELPSGFLGIYDRIHSRAIVIANENKTVALVTLDVGAIPNEMAKSLLEKIATQTGIPTTNIMLTATHTHSVPFRIGGEAFEAKVVNSVKQAKDKLQPAKIGYGEGVSYINVNRNIIDPKTRRWWEGPNYDGPSDKTVAVVTFETLDGKPIAVHYNYAMHAVTVGMLDMVSGDAPGTTSKYIEDTFDDKIVAVWSTGACGDQNPIYFQQTYDLREIRIKEYASRGIDISNKMPPGGQGLNRNDPQVAKLMQQQKQMIVSMGQFLGEEVMHVMRGIERKESNIKIYANQKIVTCPGRKRLDEGRAGYAGTYEDADSIDIKLGLISINDIAFSSVGGEVFNPISTRLKKESPFAHTMMLTLTNGYAKSGYIPHDAAFGTYTFEVVSSRLKPGFAESAIVNGILDMMYESKQLQK